RANLLPDLSPGPPTLGARCLVVAAALAPSSRERLACLLQDRVELALLVLGEGEIPDERRAHLAESAPTGTASAPATCRPGRTRSWTPTAARVHSGTRSTSPARDTTVCRPEAERRVRHPERVLSPVGLDPHVGGHPRQEREVRVLDRDDGRITDHV